MLCPAAGIYRLPLGSETKKLKPMKSCSKLTLGFREIVHFMSMKSWYKISAIIISENSIKVNEKLNL